MQETEVCLRFYKGCRGKILNHPATYFRGMVFYEGTRKVVIHDILKKK
jgi:hypothetical protein